MVKFLKRAFETCDNEQDNVPSTSNVVKKQKLDINTITRVIYFSLINILRVLYLLKFYLPLILPEEQMNFKLKKLVKRQYREDYIQYGFSWCGNKDAPKPLCVVCGEQLGNEAMVFSKLIGHLNTKHALNAHKNKNYLQRMLSQNKKQVCYIKLSFTVSEKASEASYHVARY